MKKIFYLAAIALCFSMAATSCKKDNHKEKSTIEELGNGIYKVNGYRFVDLGLPSGLLWAETNLGASEATAAGNYYAWGETASKTEFTKDNYKFGKDESSYTKYSSKDGKQALESSDDAVVAAWKKPCRMPLDTEFKELLNNTEVSWATKNNVVGYEFKSKSNSNSIFLPATKYTDTKPQGDYWTASMTVSVPMDYDLATYFQGNEEYKGLGGGMDRYNGNSIRPVASIKK